MELPKLTCNRCGHTWTPRDTMNPKRCARCRSPYWATARKEAQKGERDAR